MQALQLPPGKSQAIEELFERNGWTNGWRNGIYDYHHYHSTTHEVLGVFSGHCTVQLGGDSGITVTCTDVCTFRCLVRENNAINYFLSIV